MYLQFSLVLLYLLSPAGTKVICQNEIIATDHFVDCETFVSQVEDCLPVETSRCIRGSPERTDRCAHFHCWVSFGLVRNI